MGPPGGLRLDLTKAKMSIAKKTIARVIRAEIEVLGGKVSTTSTTTGTKAVVTSLG